MGFISAIGKAVSSGFGLSEQRQAPQSQPNGSDGVQAYGGFLVSGEKRPELTGDMKWVTYANARNTAIVATGLRRTLNMLAGTEWHAEENASGGRAAKKGVDIVTKGLLNSVAMPQPFSNVVRKMAVGSYYGFAMSEWSIKSANDLIVFSDIGHRPQHTIIRWDKPDERKP